MSAIAEAPPLVLPLSAGALSPRPSPEVSEPAEPLGLGTSVQPGQPGTTPAGLPGLLDENSSLLGDSSPLLGESPPLLGESSPLIVRFRDVGKAFRRFDFQPFLLRNLLLKLTGRAKPPREFWPLRHISFDIRRGETVGVIGQNGSGKSTLLRLLAGACYPTEGRISVRGRIAPLLALGAGFQPDMTGRECVEVNGTALGLTSTEIDDRMGDILHFAELTDFLDTPVRYYSSGMLARQAGEKRIAWHSHIARDCQVQIDETPLRQILTNLLSNAVKYTRPGGTITLAASRLDDGALRLSIKDTGVGMNADDLRNAFVPFSRSLRNPYVAANSGVGLGLPITKMLCDRFQISLTLQSVPDVGTIAEIIFPAGMVMGVLTPRSASNGTRATHILAH